MQVAGPPVRGAGTPFLLDPREMDVSSMANPRTSRAMEVFPFAKIIYNWRLSETNIMKVVTGNLMEFPLHHV